MNCYSFGSHLLSWQISANFRSSLTADLQLSQQCPLRARSGRDVPLFGLPNLMSYYNITAC